MSPVCLRCALRIQRAVRTSQIDAARSFSTTARRDAVPQFRDTPSAELNAALSTLRLKHFIPSRLTRRDRNYITNEHNKRSLEENPLTVDIGGGEEINFTFFDKFDRTGRSELVKSAVNLMATSENGEGWKELPSLLIGLKNMNRPPPPRVMAKIVRKAVQAGQAGVIIDCLTRSRQTGMYISQKDVLEHMVWSIREVTWRSGWEQGQVQAAMSEYKRIATLMETELSGRRWVFYNDPRARPEVIGIFLETAAVRAKRYTEGRDSDGSVRAYAERLISVVKGHSWAPEETPAKAGPQLGMIYGSSVYHGLRLAQEVLGSKLPNADEAKTLLADLEARLNNLEQAIAAENPEQGSYGDQALSMWREIKSSF